MNKLSADDSRLLDTLREAGCEAVERKRRLGQYAVVWRDGQPTFIGPNPPKLETGYAKGAPTGQHAIGVRDEVRDHESD